MTNNKEVVWECDINSASKTGWVQGGGMLSKGANGTTRRYPKIDELCHMSSGFLREEC